MNAGLSSADRSKLAKLLALADSDFLGERQSAVLAACRMVKAKGLTWEEILDPPQTRQEQLYTPPAYDTEPDWLDEYFYVHSNVSYCNSWEQNFLGSISPESRLTQKQRNVLLRIADTLRSKGVAG